MRYKECKQLVNEFTGLRTRAQRERDRRRAPIAHHGQLDRLPRLGMEDQVAVEFLEIVDRPPIDSHDQVAAAPGGGTVSYTHLTLPTSDLV